MNKYLVVVFALVTVIVVYFVLVLAGFPGLKKLPPLTDAEVKELRKTLSEIESTLAEIDPKELPCLHCQEIRESLARLQNAVRHGNPSRESSSD
jgi:hypothetical protein